MLARIKFELSALAKEIVNKLPAELFTSSTTTFLDPAMAGGQFLVEIIRKLRDNSHSDENIASRVFGLAEDKLDLKFAQRKNGVIGQLSVGGIETLENYKNMGKKFDVVIGNPPYQAELKTLQNRLWMQFVDRAFELVTDGGHVCMVTPSNWTTDPDLYSKWFVQKDPLYINVEQCGKHFPGIGISFSCYVICNTPRQQHMVEFVSPTATFNAQLPEQLLGSNLNALPVLQKVLFSAVDTIGVAYAPQTHYSYRKAGKISDVQTPEYCYPVLMSPKSSKKPEQWVWGKVQCPRQTGPRVVVYTYPGAWRESVVSDDLQTTHGFIHIPAATMQEAHFLHDVLTSKLYTFVVRATNSIRNINARSVQALPRVDLTRSWTDQELYAHFNLTQEEIDLIEATVK